MNKYLFYDYIKYRHFDYGLLFLGFEDKTVSWSLPAISHVNKDGYLPKLEITTTDTGNRIDFRLCCKSDDASKTDFAYRFPYAVLSFNQVGTFRK